MQNRSLSKQLGSALANFQDLFDTIAKVFFKRIKEKPGTGFFSELGESYYKSYEEAKRNAED
ncbi:MAG TPA: hypothetical protein EYN76_03820 [Candidatus Marinimicrobia bacterium]|nr:hypothetical protein [Candidatus Neomarinimicrobiota bacterium]HIA90680.1 hypothetical protein [Candidatus Neomarinimicrobiota bacterium]HIB60894.1 hypothetical protein [Candidatus Neomarinimicrobiota bacterium]